MSVEVHSSYGFIFLQVTSVSGDLYLNHYGNPPWWSFSNIGASDVEGCNGLAGPMAIVISEETPRMYTSLFCYYVDIKNLTSRL